MITTTRASARTCTKADGTVVTLTSNQPCVAGSPLGLYSEIAVTNLILRSEEFDNASWVKTNVTVVANQAGAPDGTSTMDLLTSTADGGFVESTTAVPSQSKSIVAVWVKTDGGTQAGTIILRDTTSNADMCTTNFTATTTSTRVWCRNFGGITGGHNHTMRLYPGGADGGVGSLLAWGGEFAQSITGMPVLRYVPTAGTTVASSQDVITVTNPLPASGWCYAITVSRPEVGSWASSADAVQPGGLGSAPTGANTSSLGTTAGDLVLTVTDATATTKTRQSNSVPITGAEHRICACNVGGTSTIYVDAVEPTSVSLGTGTNSITSAPANIRLGSLSTVQAGTVKLRNFAFGLGIGVCSQ